MELINLLKKKNWDESAPPFTDLEIQKAMRNKVRFNVELLYRSYFTGLGLNLLFILIFLVIYWLNPRIEFLIPLALIIGSFLFIAINLSVTLIQNEPIDTSNDLKTVLKEALSLNNKIYQNLCSHTTMIWTLSFFGGLFLGLAFQGWTIETFIEKPIIFPVLSALTIGFYLWVKSTSFKNLNKVLNPKYIEAKSYLEQQLEILSADE